MFFVIDIKETDTVRGWHFRWTIHALDTDEKKVVLDPGKYAATYINVKPRVLVLSPLYNDDDEDCVPSSKHHYLVTGCRSLKDAEIQKGGLRR